MTITEGVKAVIRSVPDRWPVPLPITAGIAVTLMLSVNTLVTFDMVKDFVTTNVFVSLRPAQCRSEIFDYIIVGAGAAGMVVATRVANASLDKSVLLLEAGGEPSILNEIPSLALLLSNMPANTWVYNTTPQENACWHCDDRRVLFTGGKMLGGSTATNFMMYVRGNKEDFNRWSVEDAGGDPQWSYESLLPYFKKFENYEGAHRYREDAGVYHGRGGLLNIFSDYLMQGKEFIDAARERGYRIGDYNGADQEVFSPVDVTTKDGWREHTYRAYFRDTGRAPNLCIRKFAHVIRVNFEKSLSGKARAVGVTYKRHNKVVHVWARNEVILSAGTIGSAKLLLLSGVGPRRDLEALDVRTNSFSVNKMEIAR